MRAKQKSGPVGAALFVISLSRYEWEESHEARVFDRKGQLALVLARNASAAL